MISTEPNGVIAVFPTVSSANRGIEGLLTQRFDMREVSVIGPGYAKVDVPPELDTSSKHSGEIARQWAKWGAIVGATTGGSVVAIPLMAALVGLGPFAPVLAAIAVGSTVVGSMASALVGYGVHAKNAHEYETALQSGKTVIVAHASKFADLKVAREALTRANPDTIVAHGLKALS
ncbi:MAG: hypothetical protein ACI9KE_004755 [Polyangiales bacterium]|jgi:hypothetical protein